MSGGKRKPKRNAVFVLHSTKTSLTAYVPSPEVEAQNRAARARKEAAARKFNDDAT